MMKKMFMVLAAAVLASFCCLTALGWKPRHSSREAVTEAAGRLAAEKKKS